MRTAPWTVRIPGTLLLIAAGLKIWGLGVDPVGRIAWFSLPEVQLAIVICEIALGIWLWSGANPIASWITALATFVAFAGIAAYMGVIGQSSCGCFGRLSPSPWIAFTLDLAMIALLGIGRPNWSELGERPWRTMAVRCLPGIYGALAVAAIAGVLAASAHAAFGSLPAALAHFRGDRVSVWPGMFDVGNGAPGEERAVTVEVSNWTDAPVRVIGGTADCSCTVLGDLPVIIPPKESRPITVVVRLSDKAGRFTRKAALNVEDDGLKTIGFRLTGRVVENPKGGSS